MSEEVNGPELLCVGLSRTGTISLQAAITKLGYGPCYHMVEVLAANTACEDAQEWLKAYRGEPADLKRVLKGYRATVDVPANDFYERLIKLYPNAKVILQTREPEAWAASVNNSIGRWHWDPPLGYALWDVLPNVKLQRQVARLWHAKAEKQDGTHLIDPDYMTRWIKQVKAKVPAEKLLVWNVKDGYKPVCKFLGVPVPDEPFPHMNDTEELILLAKAITVLCHVFTGLWVVAIFSWLYYGHTIFMNYLFDAPLSIWTTIASRAAVVSSFAVIAAQRRSPLMFRLLMGPSVLLTLYGAYILYILPVALGGAALLMNRARLGF